MAKVIAVLYPDPIRPSERMSRDTVTGAAQFEDAIAPFLPPEPNIRTLKRGAAKRRESVRMFG